jgi:hypothetical protein
MDRHRLGDLELRRREEWCLADSEVLIPAAIEDSIDERTVARLGGSLRLVVEGANAPVTPSAEAELEARGVLVIPDFIANAGSATAFGLLITGEATLETVYDEFLSRISRATIAVLTRRELGRTARERGEALAHQQAPTDGVDRRQHETDPTTRQGVPSRG